MVCAVYRRSSVFQIPIFWILALLDKFLDAWNSNSTISFVIAASQSQDIQKKMYTVELLFSYF